MFFSFFSFLSFFLVFLTFSALPSTAAPASVDDRADLYYGMQVRSGNISIVKSGTPTPINSTPNSPMLNRFVPLKNYDGESVVWKQGIAAKLKFEVSPYSSDELDTSEYEASQKGPSGFTTSNSGNLLNRGHQNGDQKVVQNEVPNGYKNGYFEQNHLKQSEDEEVKTVEELSFRQKSKNHENDYIFLRNSTENRPFQESESETETKTADVAVGPAISFDDLNSSDDKFDNDKLSSDFECMPHSDRFEGVWSQMTSECL